MENTRKFFIINNGMKDLRGHYFETSVSIATAAREMGLEPILCSHVTCDDSIAPAGIEVHRVFTTDHWMAEPPPPPLDLSGLRGELGPVVVASGHALLAGGIDFGEYLAARFGSGAVESQSVVEPVLPRLGVPTSTNQFARIVAKCKREIKRVVRQVCGRPTLQVRMSDEATCPRDAEPYHASPGSQPTPPSSEEGRSVTLCSHPGSFAEELQHIGFPQELDYVARFRQDLEQLLTMIGCTADDHVFLPTAHGRELVAIQRLVRDVGAEYLPTFHLEFRHALTEWMGVAPGDEHPYFKLHKVCFREAQTYPESDRILLYTDTEELSEQYGSITGFDFGVLPIPFRSQLIDGVSREDGPLRLAFIGDARDEKGFHWLPELVEQLMEEYVVPGRVRFLFQASPVDAPWNEGSCQALRKLREYDPAHVELVGTDGPLSPEDYFQLVSQVDVLLCPFERTAYRSRSSGTLAEAIAAGVPVVVPEGTWLARQQTVGARETFVDLPTFIAAVRRVCADYSRYQAVAEASKSRWLAFHTPGNLVQSLLNPPAWQRADWRRSA